MLVLMAEPFHDIIGSTSTYMCCVANHMLHLLRENISWHIVFRFIFFFCSFNYVVLLETESASTISIWESIIRSKTKKWQKHFFSRRSICPSSLVHSRCSADRTKQIESGAQRQKYFLPPKTIFLSNMFSISIHTVHSILIGSASLNIVNVNSIGTESISGKNKNKQYFHLPLQIEHKIHLDVRFVFVLFFCTSRSSVLIPSIAYGKISTNGQVVDANDGKKLEVPFHWEYLVSIDLCPSNVFITFVYRRQGHLANVLLPNSTYNREVLLDEYVVSAAKVYSTRLQWNWHHSRKFLHSLDWIAPDKVNCWESIWARCCDGDAHKMNCGGRKLIVSRDITISLDMDYDVVGQAMVNILHSPTHRGHEWWNTNAASNWFDRHTVQQFIHYYKHIEFTWTLWWIWLHQCHCLPLPHTT